MKKALNILTVSLVLSWLATGCKKEAKLTPTPDPENVYSGNTLPQGNHPYDAEIQQLFNKYNTLFLYKYTPKDLYYNVNTYLGGTYDTASNTTTVAGLFDVPADQAYVGEQLDMLKSIWLNYYPDSLLKQGLPQKVYLVDSLYFALTGPGTPEYNLYQTYNMYQGGDYLLVTYGSARVESMSNADKDALRGSLNASFLAYAHAAGAVKRSPAFTALTNYAAINYSNYQSLGVIDYFRSGVESDWDAFVETIVSNSYTTLTSPGNVLSPDVDTQGLIMKKYNVVIAYFMSAFGVDLQAIGNANI